MELYAERQAEPPPLAGLLAALTAGAPGAPGAVPPSDSTGAMFPVAASAAVSASMAPQLGRLLRTRLDRISLRGWR
jgi:hypothetical protein